VGRRAARSKGKSGSRVRTLRRGIGKKKRRVASGFDTKPFHSDQGKAARIVGDQRGKKTNGSNTFCRDERLTMQVGGLGA